MKDSDIISYGLKTVNPLTGEIETTQAYIKNKSKIYKSKRGWTKMYRIKYDEVAREMTSKLEYDIMAYIRDSNIPKTFVLSFSIEKITRDFNTTRNTVAKAIRKLRDLEFIVKVNNTYLLNPFIYVPPLVCDDVIAEAQENWENNLKISKGK